MLYLRMTMPQEGVLLTRANNDWVRCFYPNQFVQVFKYNSENVLLPSYFPQPWEMHYWYYSGISSTPADSVAQRGVPLGGMKCKIILFNKKLWFFIKCLMHLVRTPKTVACCCRGLAYTNSCLIFCDCALNLTTHNV